ncbi:hypothetical protein [Nostoc sp.]|uniref:hypothetical protein n=1 Tax=Nostoc sp. TaxID=1180 RepID=UPI002FFC5462
MSSLAKAMVFPSGVNATLLDLLQKLLLQGVGERLLGLGKFHTFTPYPFATSARSLLCNPKQRLIYQLDVFNS